MEATVLAQEFQRQFKTKYNYYPYSMKTVKTSKWWNHFTGFCYKSRLDDGSEKKFIEKLFAKWDNESKIYPYVLSQKIADDVESSMLGQTIEDTESLSEDDYINLTLKKATIWAKRNNIEENKLGRFLTDQACIMRALRGEFYKPLFMFSSSFLNQYGQLSEEEILKKNSIRAFHPELYDALKASLNVSFVD